MTSPIFTIADGIHLVLAHVESVAVDHFGSGHRFVTMSSGKVYRVSTDEGERIIKALSGGVAA